MNFFEKLKSRWELTSNWQVAVVFFVFAITGSTSVKVATPILEFLGITNDMNPFLYWPIRIIAIFPAYQVLLIIFGTLCGQFRFFWNFEKKMFSRFGGKSKKVS